MFSLNNFVVLLALISILFSFSSGNLILYSQTSQNLSDLEYLNQDLEAVDKVVLRPSEAQMGKARMDSGDSSIPKYDPVVDIKTCTKQKTYSFLYGLVKEPSIFSNFSTPNKQLQQQAQIFFDDARIQNSINPLKSNIYPSEETEYTTLSYTTAENDTKANVEILLNTKIFFYRKSTVNAILRKEKINFQIEYQDSKCQIVGTNFFEIVLKNKQQNQSNGIILSIFLLAIFLIFVTITWLIGKFLWNLILAKKN